MDDQTIDKFLEEYESLCCKYGLSLGHQDRQGAFVVEVFKEYNIVWVKAASRVAKYSREEVKTMTREIDLVLYFCPECKREEPVGGGAYCSHCGTRVMRVEVTVCMEGEKVERLVLRGSG